MTDAQSIVAGRVSCAKTGAAEGGSDDGSCIHQIGYSPFLNQIRKHRLGRWINGKREFSAAAVSAPQRLRRFHYVGIIASGTACNHSLLNHQILSLHLVKKCKMRSASGYSLCLLFRKSQNIRKILLQFVDLIHIAWVKRQGDHGLYCGQIHINAAVIVSHSLWIQLRKVPGPMMLCQICFCIVICAPDGGKAGGLRSHHIYTVSKIRSHGGNAGANKFHYLIFHISVLKHRSDNGKGNILGACAGPWRTVQVYGYHAGIGNIVCIAKKLFYQLASALSHCHSTQSTVTGVTV